MSRLTAAAGQSFDDLLALAPGAAEADREMRRQIQSGLTPRLYSLIGVAVAGLLGCERFERALRGPLDDSLTSQIAADWTKAPVSEQERAILAFTEKGTLNEAAIRRDDVDALRRAGLSDRDLLTVATAIAYHNYSIRIAAAFDVNPR